jgi:hypothetical protein
MADPAVAPQPGNQQAPPQTVTLDAPANVPQTVTLDQPLSTSGQAAPQQPFDEKIESTVGDVGTGFLKGLGDTTHGVGELLRKGGNLISTGSTEPEQGGLGNALIPKTGQEAFAQMNKPSNTAQWVGYGGETLTEFLLGDEALKGLSLADKLKQAGAVANILQKSPRLMRAIQMGADVSKAEATLGPAEREAIKNSPVIARLIGTAMDAIRQGTVQAAQTGVRTGNAKQSAEEGGEMALTSGLMGGAAGVVGGTLEKAGKAAKTAETLQNTAKAAPTEPEITQTAKTAVDNVEKAMHDKFEAGIQDLKARLGDTQVPNTESPIAKKSAEILKPPEPAEHELVAAAKNATGERLDPTVKGLLKKAANSEQPWTVNDLVDFRQSVRKLADSYEIGDPNARALRQILPSVDDTLDKLAQGSGDAAAKQDYAALRKDYKDTVKYFQKPPAKDKAGQLAYNVAQTLQGGNKDAISDYLFKGGNTRAKAEAVQSLLGPEQTKELGKDIFGAMVKESAPTEGQRAAGQINPANLVQKWTKIDPAIRDIYFDKTASDQAINELMKDAHSAANIQHLMRATGAAAAGTAIPAFIHSGLGTLLGLAVGEGVGGFGKGRQLLDYVVTHPNTWKALGLAGRVSEAASPAARAVGPAVKEQTTRMLSGNPSLATVYGGAQQPLSQEEQQ